MEDIKYKNDKSNYLTNPTMYKDICTQRYYYMDQIIERSRLRGFLEEGLQKLETNIRFCDICSVTIKTDYRSVACGIDIFEQLLRFCKPSQIQNAIRLFIKNKEKNVNAITEVNDELFIITVTLSVDCELFE